MSSFTIYPAIDLRAGQVVRLKEGDPTRKTIYSDDPAQTARRWLELGAQWLHVVNLDGAFAQSDSMNQAALRAILETANKFDARVQFGGGVRSLEMVKRVMDIGVSRVVLGTIAIEQERVVVEALQEFGAEKITVGIDARDGSVRVRGWQANSGIRANELALQMRSLGVSIIIFTDISRDGLGSGLNLVSSCELATASGLEVIASGGVHTLDDVIGAREANLAGAIIGRALYEGTIDLREALKIANHEGPQGTQNESFLR
jgi:phosphoribosylformimino-5-aminoimidazole carboxamide ribotide isomerase